MSGTCRALDQFERFGAAERGEFVKRGIQTFILVVSSGFGSASSTENAGRSRRR